MSLKYTAGARTRNVVNIGTPGGTTPTVSITEDNGIPSGATAGFKNFHSQKTLHVLIHNNGLVVGGGGAINVSAIKIWGYNSSLGGLWTVLTHTERASGAETLIYPEYNNIAVAKDIKIRLIIPIEGIERIYVQGTTFSGTRSAGSLDIYLGVNSI